MASFYGRCSWRGMYLTSHPCPPDCHLPFPTQGNKLASGILFAVLLNFKHIYMYLAVCPPLYQSFYISPLPASIFCVSPQILLYFPCWGDSSQEFPLVGQRCYCRFRRVSRPFRPNRSNTPATFKIISFYPRLKSRILGP
jgi:hypothetical protein